MDNYIYEGTPLCICKFDVVLQQEFDVGELEFNTFPVYGCELEQQKDKFVTITQLKKLEKLQGAAV